MLSAKISDGSFKKAEYPLHQLIHPGHLETPITLSNLNIDVKLLAQGCYVAIVSLSLL